MDRDISFKSQGTRFQNPRRVKMTMQKDFPAEAQGLNWGAMFLGPIWGLFNSIGCGPVLILCIIPIVGLFKGNEWAWRGKEWASVEAFKATQKKWTMSGLIFLVVCVALACLLSVIPAMMGGGGN